MLFVYFILIASVVSRSIPIRFNELNDPIIPNVVVPGFQNRTTLAQTRTTGLALLNFRSACYVLVDDGDEYRRLERGGIRLEDGFVLIPRDEALPDYYHGYEICRNAAGIRVDAIADIGIDPDSFMVQQYNEISVLRNISSDSGVLILNDTDGDQFNRSCVPETIVRIPLLSARFRAAQMDYRLISQQDGENRQALIMSETPRNPTRLYNPANLLTIPTALTSAIHDAIIASGTVRVGETTTFDNCYFDSLSEQLPKIILHIRENGADLVLFPEDYVEYNRDANQCILKVLGEDSSHQPGVNILRIPNTNIHISSTEMLICDTQ
jgi:hypothetical protein